MYFTDDFEEFVPATQEPFRTSLTPKSKVQAWLTGGGDQSKAKDTTTSSAQKRRRKSINGISKFLIDRSQNSSVNQGSSKNTSKNSSTDNISAELAKIMENNPTPPTTAINSSEESTPPETLPHDPYRPPSFQNYSSESAKALLAKYEAGKLSLSDSKSSSNLRKTRSLESAGSPVNLPLQPNTDQQNNSPQKCRKTRSLEVPSNGHLNILEGVRAYVEVRSKNENRSDVVINQLIALGGIVEPKLGNKCTHIIFKEGSLTTYTKAKKLGIFIVSASWLDACRKENRIVSENLFPPMNQEKYDSPGMFPKLRKGKSLQPKTDEEFAKLIEAKTKRIMKKRLAEDSPINGTPPKKALKVLSQNHIIMILNRILFQIYIFLTFFSGS